MSRTLPLPRVLRIGGSLAIVLVAYGTYALVAVPLIEPSVELRRQGPISDQDRNPGGDPAQRQLSELQGLFLPDAWELGEPKVLKSDRVRLLFQDYRNLGGNDETGYQVELRPMTIVFMPKEPVDDEAMRKRRAMILQVPEGALLTFDQPFDLRRAKIGRLVGGELRGQVLIHGQGKLPGPEDDLWIASRGVRLTEQQIWTPDPVEFRWGPHYGRGQHMVIELLPGEETGTHGPNVAGIAWFELKRIQQLHLELGQAARPVENSPTPAPAEDSLPKPEKKLSGSLFRRDGETSLPLEIACRGRFRFDFVKKVATFEDRVDVMHLNPEGPSDQLQCELLSIFFTDKTEPAPASEQPGGVTPKKPSSATLDLKPQRIEARGYPVVVSAPSESLQARGQRLSYDLLAERLVLDGELPVMLQHGPNQLHAQSLDYRSAGPGRLGQVLATGPGWLRGQTDDRPDRQLEAHWGQLLHLRPHEENQVISLTGGARLEAHDIGRLQAPEIHFYLLEVPLAERPGRYDVRPDRLLALGGGEPNNGQPARQGLPPAGPDDTAPAEPNVVIESPQLSAVVERLEVWFEQDPTEAAAAAGALGQADSPVGSPPPAALPPADAPAAEGHFEIVGRLLRAKLRLAEGEQAKLSELTVEDGVEFVESRTRKPGELPVLIRGDRLHAIDADQPHAAVTVVGKPAHFQGRGMSLSARNVSLNRGTNRLWVDGAGRMELPVKTDLEGRPLDEPTLLELLWQRGMEFDGRTAQFEEAVTASTPNQHLQTETLEVRLTRPIDFSANKIQEGLKPEIEQLLCRGGVLMESREFAGRVQTSTERMQVADLAVNLVSGALTAGGPGWVRSIRHESGGLLPGAAPRRDGNQRLGLHVRFQDRITGDVKNRQLTFHEQVRVTFAPVDSWEATLDVDRPEEVGPGGAVMRCRQLSVSELRGPAGTSRELEAVGSVVVEGITEDGNFTARAARMTYDEAKDLLILEGDGHSDASLFRQQQIGGPLSEFTARKIRYWPRTNRCLKVDGARSLRGQFPAARRAAP
ncbi:MAG: hypothetical protein JXB62_18775 [Pirellulales bacterium]|nr:hypothetical protein [Pirellulales bacterium]